MSDPAEADATPNPRADELRAAASLGLDRFAQAAPHYDPADVADVLRALPPKDAARAFAALAPAQRVGAFEHLDDEARVALLERVPRGVVGAVLDEMSSDDRAAFFRRVPEPVRAQFLPLLAQAERDDVRRLMEFEEGTAGARMSTEYADVRPDMLVSEAVDHLRLVAPQRETVYTVYVVEADRRLVGVVSLLELITAPSSRRVRDVMREDVISTAPGTDQEEVAHTMARYDFLALPVVDEEKRLLGIVTWDDVIDVIEEEATEDVQLGSGIAPTDTAYSQAGAGLLARKRVGWLEGLLLTALVSASVIAAFEDALAEAVALAFFIPVVTGTGGNTGTQSATLIIRALSVGDVTPRQWAKVFGKELSVGVLLGVALSATIFVVGLFWPGAREVAPVVGATMIALVVWANLVGALLPLLLRGIGIDPAVAGAPLVSTIVDATGLLIYFGTASVLLDV